MPRVSFTALHMRKFNGNLGGVDFVDGISVESLTNREAERLGCVTSIRVVDEDGNATDENPSAVQVLVNATRHSRDYERVAPNGERDGADYEREPTPVGENPPEAATVPVPEKTSKKESSEPQVAWTREQLEILADEQGLPGLQEITAERELVAHTIEEAIDAILASQAD